MIPLSIRILAITAALAYVVTVLSALRRSRMSVRQSLLWILSGIVFLTLSLIPGPMVQAAAYFGFIAPSNAVFATWMLFLTVLLFYQSLITSLQSGQIKRLCQEIALLRDETNPPLTPPLRDQDSPAGDA